MSRAPGHDQAAALLAELAALDIRLWVENGSLCYNAPGGAFGPELKAKVRAAREALLLHLAAPGPTPEPGPQTVPLSSQQERMWFLNRLEGGADGYMDIGAFRLQGPLDLAALARSLTWLVARHPVLRTVFRDGPAGPEQVIQPAGPADLTVTELAGLDQAARQAAIQETLVREGGRALDLAQGPVARFGLLRFAPEDHALIILPHHAAWDGWSTGVFLRELGAGYSAFCRGGPPELPPPATTYAAYAQAQRRAMADGSLTAETAAWAGHLAGLPMTPFLPTDRPRPARASGRGGQLPVELSPELAQALARAAGRQGATLTAVLLAAYGLLLSRVSGQPSLLVGLPMAAREQLELESVVGYFVNTVPVRLDVAGAASFAGLVERSRDAILEALSHQMVPLDHLIRVLNPPRSPAHSTLIQVLFNLVPRRQDPPALEGLRVGEMERPPESARYDLSLSLAPAAGGGLTGLLIYDADLFDAATAAAWRAQYQAILAQAPADWRGPLGLTAAPAA
ncbi:MAG: condensation domain-containing protein, partial [Pseudomonadota bacterium]